MSLDLLILLGCFHFCWFEYRILLNFIAFYYTFKEIS
jgi:hypothetical protein